MTAPTPARTDTIADAIQWPDPATLVLARRRLNPATDPSMLSVFADNQWNLTPGLFEAHAKTTRLNLRSIPEPFRDPVKHYLWQLINGAPEQRQPGQLHSQLALSTLPLVLPRIWRRRSGSGTHWAGLLNDLCVATAPIFPFISALTGIRPVDGLVGRRAQPPPREPEQGRSRS